LGVDQKTIPTPEPSISLFNAHPAKQAEMKYKMKLMTISGVDKHLPTPNAMMMMQVALSDLVLIKKCKSSCAARD
jgi:hypothetical protein